MADSITEPYFAISESRLKEILRLLRLNHNYINYADVSEQVIRANPVPNNNPVPNSKELILLAQTDWHNREERKHRYEMIPWTIGWMSGFLSERKPYWPKVHEAAIRRDEREKVLDIIERDIIPRIKGDPFDLLAFGHGTIEYKELHKVVESLRTTTPTQELPYGP